MNPNQPEKQSFDTSHSNNREVFDFLPNAESSHFDELWGKGNALNPHWLTFFSQLDKTIGVNDFSERMSELNRQIKENGITYNVYADKNGPQRPWSIDLLPLIISSEEWTTIETGVQQRAKLLEEIAKDIYGSQKLVQSGLIPPALVQGHPGFMRSMHGVTPLGNKHLHIIAFDLARAPDGSWSVISQRTQAPSGLGYLLENRNLISKQFPKAFEKMHIEPVANVYRELVASMKRLSKAGDNAHIVLLTPGPYNETYFEHAYLARFLGLTLVEGGDLTVRDQKVFLKTVHGLEPVDGILKRLDDEFLDPLELRSDSTLGVPGLLEAIRANNVLLANSPGSAFLESPGLMGFLPAISEFLLNEKLQLPAMDTWWCGENAALHAAIPNLKNSALKPTYPKSTGHIYFDATLGSGLSENQLNEWIGKITRQPEEYTVQTHIPLAKLPTWQINSNNDELSVIKSRSYVLRVFALSHGMNSWNILPGGLARIASNDNGIASMQRGGSSADVWVQSKDQSTLFDHATNNDIRVIPVHRKRLITSRAAENLFWFGRYTERSENSLRLAKLNLESINNEYKPSKKFWLWLEDLSTKYGLIPKDVPIFSENGEIRHSIYERTLIKSLNNDEHTTSLGFNLRALRQSASTVRERLSQEQWSTINKCLENFDLDYSKATQHQDYSSVLAIEGLTKASTLLAAITGAQTDRMTRDDGWQLLSIGRHIERLGFLTAVLDSALKADLLSPSLSDGSTFSALLSIFDSTITFHAQYQQNRHISSLLELLVLDDENPRSLAWVSKSLRARLAKLTNSDKEQPNELISKVPNFSQYSLTKLSALDVNGIFTELNCCLEECANASWNISDELSARYFNLVHKNDYRVQI